MRTQVACQALCEEIDRSNCTGIAYSHTAKGKECYLCKDKETAESGNGFHVYRRPSKFQIVFTGIISNKSHDIYIVYICKY